MSRVNVTRTFLPPFEEYETYLKGLWESGYITNQGPLLRQFEAETEEYTGIDNFHFVANGTIALQLALHALDITEGQIITTPFSYVATTSAILWERCEPVFVDIEPETFCIDPAKIEAAITPDTKAILAVHVFGNPCAVEEIEEIAKRHGLSVIYDGAHAFGVEYRGRSIFSYGDISTCSFHATKLMHTIEGGGIFVQDVAVSEKVELLKRFGHTGDEHFMLGINAKASEFQAAMGLANFKHLPEVLEGRKKVVERYNELLDEKVGKLKIRQGASANFAYYPILVSDEGELKRIISELDKEDIFPRRYFYPSLNQLPYVSGAASCPVSEDIASRIMCLPLYPGLEDNIITKICEVVNR